MSSNIIPHCLFVCSIWETCSPPELDTLLAPAFCPDGRGLPVAPRPTQW